MSVFEKWQRIVDEFIGSGLTPSQYCKKTDININTLYTWRRRPGKINLDSKESKGSAFQELKLKEVIQAKDSSAPQIPTGGQCLSIKDKYKIDNKFDELLLTKVLRVLDELICWLSILRTVSTGDLFIWTPVFVSIYSKNLNIGWI